MAGAHTRIKYRGNLYVQAALPEAPELSPYELKQRALTLLLQDLVHAMERKRDDGQLSEEDYENLQWAARSLSVVPVTSEDTPGVVGDPLKYVREKAEELAAKFGVDYQPRWKEHLGAADVSQDDAEVVTRVLGAAGISVDQICALADGLKALCDTNNEEDDTGE